MLSSPYDFYNRGEYRLLVTSSLFSLLYICRLYIYSITAYKPFCYLQYVSNPLGGVATEGFSFCISSVILCIHKRHIYSTAYIQKQGLYQLFSVQLSTPVSGHCPGRVLGNGAGFRFPVLRKAVTIQVARHACYEPCSPVRCLKTGCQTF